MSKYKTSEAALSSSKSNSEPATLGQWLEHANQVHSQEIEMGLARVSTVAQRLGVAQPAPCTVIIAGTNGKGSTTVALEQLLLEAGLRVGATLSPHISKFNERVRLGGEQASDADLCRAFAAVDGARQEILLTYFEFATLVALWLFHEQPVDVALLEVGLGGRLDAFNLVSADVAIITSIGLDHQTFLGDDLQTIGREKAGVLRSQQQAVFGPNLPASIPAIAVELGTQTFTLGRDFEFRQDVHQWHFESVAGVPLVLPYAALAETNCALALQAAELVLAQLDPEASLSQAQALQGITRARLPGRLQPVVALGREWLLDVGHNPLAASFILGQLRQRYPTRRVVALFGQLSDKDSAAVFTLLQHRVACWVLVPTQGYRSQSSAELVAKLPTAGLESGGARSVQIAVAESFSDGVALARQRCGPRDVILAFGAFSVVEQALQTFPQAI